MMRVFISYSTCDRTHADAICEGLEGLGIRCWIAPRDIRPGRIWAAEIIAGLESSNVLVVVLSSGSNDSREVLHEVERAAALKLPILPIRLNATLPAGGLAYFVSARQWLDVPPNWNRRRVRNSPENEFAAMIEAAVRELCRDSDHKEPRKRVSDWTAPVLVRSRQLLKRFGPRFLRVERADVDETAIRLQSNADFYSRLSPRDAAEIRSGALSLRDNGAERLLETLIEKYDALSAFAHDEARWQHEYEFLAFRVRAIASQIEFAVCELISSERLGHRWAALVVLQSIPDLAYLQQLGTCCDDADPIIAFNALIALWALATVYAPLGMPEPFCTVIDATVSAADRICNNKTLLLPSTWRERAHCMYHMLDYCKEHLYSTGLCTKGDGPQIEFVRSGESIAWDGNAHNLLTFGFLNGIGIGFSCLSGSCTSCRVRVISGKVCPVTDGWHAGFRTRVGGAVEEAFELTGRRKNQHVDYQRWRDKWDAISQGELIQTSISNGYCLTCCCIPEGPVKLDA